MDVLVVGDANPDLILRGDVRPRFDRHIDLARVRVRRGRHA